MCGGEDDSLHSGSPIEPAIDQGEATFRQLVRHHGARMSRRMACNPEEPLE